MNFIRKHQSVILIWKRHCSMFPTELDDYPALSSNISFCSDLEIHYVDMTVPHKQEQEHRLRHNHTTHCTQMWVTQLLSFKNHLSSMLTHGSLYFIHTTCLYSVTVSVSQTQAGSLLPNLITTISPGRTYLMDTKFITVRSHPVAVL